MSENKKFDIVSIGGATQDVFVKTELSKLLKMRDLFSESELLCFEYGAKINVNEVMFEVGGGAVNTSTNFACLGLKTAALLKIGQDSSGDEVLKCLQEKGVDTSLVAWSETCKTGFSVILNSFEGDRTVLTFRGANNRLYEDDINWDVIKNSSWIYVSSLGGDSNQILDSLSDFAEDNGVSMSFNPGATQIKRGMSGLQRILSQTEFLILNKEEASLLTGIKQNFRYVEANTCTGCATCVDICPVNIYQIQDNKAVHAGKRENCIKGCELCVAHCPENAITVSPWASNIDELFLKLKSFGPKIIVITDGGKGVQAFDGEKRYIMPSYKVPVRSTLGAGDAFASAFTAAMISSNWDIIRSMKLAAASAASCVQDFGAQSGLKSFEELDKFISTQGDIEVIKAKMKNNHNSLSL